MEKQVVRKKNRSADFKRGKSAVKAKRKRRIAKDVYDAGDWAGQKSDGALSKLSFACDCGVCRSNNYHGRKMKQRKSNVIFEAREKDWEVEQGAGQQDGFYDHFDEFDYWG